jgi:hypothetical protein
VLEEFEITHGPKGFQEFFSRIEKHRKAQGCGVAVAMAMPGRSIAWCGSTAIGFITSTI